MSEEEQEAKEWELWRDFLYEVGSKMHYLHGETWEDTEWEKLMDLLKKKGYKVLKEEKTNG